MRVRLILNPHSRRGRESSDALRAALARADIEIVEDEEGVEKTVDAIVAAGGDGTLVRAIGSALKHGVPMGIVPLGTFNELARTLSIPLGLEAAVETIAAGAQRTIDVGCVNGRYFVNESSIGISSRITRMQTPELKRRFGMFGVIYTSFSAFRHSRPLHAEVRTDDGVARFRTIQLTIANSHRFGGFLNVSDSAIDDGWLDLYSVDITNAVEAFTIAQAMFAGRKHDVPGLRTMRSRRFQVFTRHRHHISADGEPAGTTPATFEILPQALRVIVPQ